MVGLYQLSFANSNMITDFFTFDEGCCPSKRIFIVGEVQGREFESLVEFDN